MGSWKSRFAGIVASVFCLSLGTQSAQARDPLFEPLPPALKDVRTSLWNLYEWKFQIDPKDEGAKAGWASPFFNDSSWPVLHADKRWEEQGFPGYDGIGWYRITLNVPQGWIGSKMLIQSEGIDDEYDLYVNGVYVRHFGGPGEMSVWGSPTQAEISRLIRPGLANVIALRVRDDGDGGGLWRRIQFRRVPSFDAYSKMLPSPVLDSHPEWVSMYWAAWKMAWEKISFGNEENGFVPAYMDEGYNEHIYQWDSIFMTLFGRYGAELFPVMTTLDNFYVKQEPNGYIARIYSETNGGKLVEPSDWAPITNPSLFAWSEWEYYRTTGDQSRFARVLAILERYDDWQKIHQRAPEGRGLYFSTGFDSGMDNMPRPNAERAGWVDISLQQALAAKYMSQMASVLGDRAKEQRWMREFGERRDVVNRLAWSENDGIYYDVDRDGRWTGVRHIGAMWALLASVASPDQAKKLIGHLKNPNEFYRTHLFPALSASDPLYSPTASYWRGGVWAPTNYMTIQGLMAYGNEDFAYEASMNHLTRLAQVRASAIDPAHVDPNEADGEYQTLWECYNPDHVIPCTRADAYYYGRQDFVGWTGLGPIALLIEQAIGLEMIGAENTVVWRLRDQGRTGLLAMPFAGDNRVSLVADAVVGGQRRVSVRAAKAFTLRLRTRAGENVFRAPAGDWSVTVRD